MVAATDNLLSTVVELSQEAFQAFCVDLSTMFETEMSCSRKEAGSKTFGDVKKHFRKVCAVHTFHAHGAINGKLHLVFDQGALFTMAGVIVMLPERRILEESKIGTVKDAQAMADAVGEMGNLLAGTWDRVFRAELPNHKHLRKVSSFIGMPWENPAEVLGLQATDPFEFILYEMTIKPYPSFLCGVLLPPKIFDPSAPDEAPPLPPDQASVTQPEPGEDTPAASKDAEAGGGDVGSKTPEATQSGASPSPPAETTVVVEPQVQVSMQPNSQIADMAEPPLKYSPAPIPMVDADVFGGVLALRAKEVMDRQVLWVSPEDGVSEVLTRMQQLDVGYALVGNNGALEGIASSSNLLGALSPYLRPLFAKWKRPADEATLNIKVKWVMSRPVRTVTTDASLAAVMGHMQQFGGRCLPVLDPSGKVQGLITVFDVFKAITRTQQFPVVGRTPQAPCVMI